MKGNTFYPRQERKCALFQNTKSVENEPMSLAILLAGRPIFRKGLMSHEDKSRGNIQSVKCYYMYTISQYIKSRNDLELQYSPISIRVSSLVLVVNLLLVNESSRTNK